LARFLRVAKRDSVPECGGPAPLAARPEKE
jgi:hypothetical protein